MAKCFTQYCYNNMQRGLTYNNNIIIITLHNKIVLLKIKVLS